MIKRKKAVKSKRNKRAVIFLIIMIIVLAAYFGLDIYQKIYSPNIQNIPEDDKYLYIPTNSTYNDVLHILSKKQIIKDRTSFEWVAEKMNYSKHIHAGRYKINEKMSNRDLVKLLRSGEQTPVKLMLHNITSKSMLAGMVSKKLEADSLVLLNMLNDKVFLRTRHLTIDNVMAIFIPNTYEIFWNTDARGFFDRIIIEYDNFWTDERLKKAEKLKLSPIEVIILASIVQKETLFNDEKKIVSGVYLNRLHKGWKLQADPTLIFAIEQQGNSTFLKSQKKIRRVLKAHKEFDTPYNTYIYTGLPPGPICQPEISTINAVLSPAKHDYMYFCAKEDFSGYHNFAETYKQHNANAKKYRDALNRRKIYQ